MLQLNEQNVKKIDPLWLLAETNGIRTIAPLRLYGCGVFFAGGMVLGCLLEGDVKVCNY